MASGYNSDQFYRFTDYEGKTSSVKRKKDDNPNFAYPGPRMHDVFNAPTSDITVRDANESRLNTKMQRGFIRGIYPATLANVKKTNYSAATMKQRRLFFQFNPATLDRTVQMSTSVLNPLLQDPTNLLQPVPGTADFSFDLLFNREFEVYNSAYSDTNNQTQAVNQITRSLENYGGSNYSPTDVASLGVLADIYVLDSIIGQSITKDMVEFLKDYWNNASTLSQASFQPSTSGSSFSFDSTGFDSTVEKNLGNSAFLSPLPVRIVFSSLFMVEGYVTMNSVQFIKFSKNYVPTVAKVSLSIRALYMGFARQKPYLTSALETAVVDMQKQKDQDNATVAKMRNFAKYGISFIYTFPKGFKKGNTRAGAMDSPTGSPVSSFPSFYDFYKDDADFWFIWGEVRSWVSPQLAQAVSKNECTWDFSARFKLIEVRPDDTDVAVALIDSEIKYLKHSNEFNSNNYLSNTEIANNANKAQTEKGSRINWYRWAWNDTALKQKMESESSSVRLEITHSVTITFTLINGGEQKITEEITEEKIFKTIDDWSKFNYIDGGQIRVLNRAPSAGGGAYKS